MKSEMKIFGERGKEGIENNCFHCQGMRHFSRECPKRLEEMRCWNVGVKRCIYIYIYRERE